jgi:hypothetical protein
MEQLPLNLKEEVWLTKVMHILGLNPHNPEHNTWLGRILINDPDVRIQASALSRIDPENGSRYLAQYVVGQDTPLTLRIRAYRKIRSITHLACRLNALHIIRKGARTEGWRMCVRNRIVNIVESSVSAYAQNIIVVPFGAPREYVWVYYKALQERSAQLEVRRTPA